MKYGNRSPWKRYMSSPLALILSIILLIFVAKASFGINQKSAMSASRLAQAQTEFNKLKSRQDDLSNKVGHLSSDGGLESEIRSKYRAIKEGESVAVIVDDVKAPSSTTITASVVDTKQSFWSRVWHAVGL
jgi:cell division protein FtsB